MYREPLGIYTEYKDEIHHWRREGRIIYPFSTSHWQGGKDEHGHLPDKDDYYSTYWRPGALRVCNTRALAPEGKTLLEYFRKRGGKFRFMEIGHGAGHGCSDVYEELKDSGLQTEIHSVGLTPLSPVRGLRVAAVDAIIAASKNEAFEATQLSPLAADPFEELIRDALWLKQNECTGKWRLGLDAAMQLQKQFGQQIFAILSHPFIDRQYIGRFDAIQFQEESYDMVYEDRAYLRHGDGSFEERLEKVLRLLNDNGVLIFINTWEQTLEMQNFLWGNSEYIAVEQDNDDPDEERDVIYMMARRNSDLGQKILEAIEQKDGKQATEKELHKVPKLQDFLKAVIPDIPAVDTPSAVAA